MSNYKAVIVIKSFALSIYTVGLGVIFFTIIILYGGMDSITKLSEITYKLFIIIFSPSVILVINNSFSKNNIIFIITLILLIQIGIWWLIWIFVLTILHTINKHRKTGKTIQS